MTSEPRHRTYGTPMSEWISLVGDLDRDATGVWQLVPDGRDGFGLQGDELIDFVRRSIHALLEAGAIPVRGGVDTEYVWIPLKQYGSTNEDICEAVIAEWLREAHDPSLLYKVWFARPNPALPKFVKLD